MFVDEDTSKSFMNHVRQDIDFSFISLYLTQTLMFTLNRNHSSSRGAECFGNFHCPFATLQMEKKR